jgi:hypothetical protein
MSAMSEFVVVVSGPIASGKSSLARALAIRLEETSGIAVAVVDLDLVYEMLDPAGRPKSDGSLWSLARRIAGRLAAALLAEGRCVVVEGDLATDLALGEFEDELPGAVAVRLVMLELDFDTALARARRDPSRGLSRDRRFLSSHYDEFTGEWSGRDALRLQTGTASLAETATAALAWVAPAR